MSSVFLPTAKFLNHPERIVAEDRYQIIVDVGRETLSTTPWTVNIVDMYIFVTTISEMLRQD